MKIDPRRVRISVQPTEEPITLADAKLHLRIDHNAEDGLIGRLIQVARQQCEEIARRSFVTRTYVAQLDQFPFGDRQIEFPFPPLINVTSVNYTDEDGAAFVLSASSYIVDAYTDPGILILKNNFEWPSVTMESRNGLSITFTAGYGTAVNVPAKYKQAMLLLVGHLYENREAVLVGVQNQALLMALDNLLLTDRGMW